MLTFGRIAVALSCVAGGLISSVFIVRLLLVDEVEVGVLLSSVKVIEGADSVECAAAL